MLRNKLFVVTALTLLGGGTAFAAPVQPPIKVPMPGSLALLATGIAGLAAAGWWLRKK